MRETSSITKKGAAVALAAVTAMSLSVPATALADEEAAMGSDTGTTTTTTTTTSNDVEGVLTGTTSGSTAVTTAYTSEYTVTLPESVAMGSSHSDTQTASVTVKGKIAAGKQVNVVPAETITMSSTETTDTYDLTVTAGTTSWSQSDVTATGTAKDNATISAGDAWLPGTFSGSLTYTISLGDETASATTDGTYTFYNLDATMTLSPMTITLGDGVDTTKTFAEAGSVPVTISNGSDSANMYLFTTAYGNGTYVFIAFDSTDEGSNSRNFLAKSDTTNMDDEKWESVLISADTAIKDLPSTFYSCYISGFNSSSNATKD